MRKLTNICVAIGLSLTVTGSTLADEPEELRDASGRLIESVDENGIRVRYIYDQQGNLQEARYSDGRIEHFEPVSE